MAEIEVEVKSEIEQLIKEMRELDQVATLLGKSFNVDEKEAKKLAAQLKRMQAAEDKAAAAAARLNAKQDKTAQGFAIMRKGAEAIQGPLGSFATRTIAAAEGVGKLVTSMGPLGVVLAAAVAQVGLWAAAVLGTVGAVAAADALTRAAIDASKALEEIRSQSYELTKLSPTNTRALNDAQEAYSELAIAANELTELLGSRTAPVMALLSTGAAALAHQAALAGTAFFEWYDFLVPFQEKLHQVKNLIEEVSGLSQIQEQAAVRAAQATMAKSLAISIEYTETKRLKDGIEALKRQREAESEAQKKALELQRDYVKELAAFRRGMDEALAIEERALGIVRQGIDQSNERINIQRETRKVLQQLAEDEVRLLELKQAGIPVNKQLMDVEQARYAALTEQERQLAALQSELQASHDQRQLDALEALEKRSQQAAATMTANFQNALGMAQQISAGIFDLIEQGFGDTSNLTREQFEKLKRLRKTEAVINAFASSALALANPPGPPFTIPIAALAFAQGIAAAAAIEKQTYQAHSGSPASTSALAPDESMARVRSNESVLTKQQMERLAGSGGGGAQTINLVVGNRVVQSIGVKAAKGTGRGSTALRRKDRSGHRRRGR